MIGVVPCDYFFIAAARTMTDPEHPISTVDDGEEELGAKPGRTFRIIPSLMCAPENNRSIANMDFDEFAEAVDSDGVYRKPILGE